MVVHAETLGSPGDPPLGSAHEKKNTHSPFENVAHLLELKGIVT